jgi:DNA polymerase III delta prime subunit
MPSFAGPFEGAEPRRISPTDVSQFIRLEQCERYLRLRLHERAAGPGFLREYGVTAHPLPPLLTRAGLSFEQVVEGAAEAHTPKLNLATEARRKQQRGDDNERILQLARGLAPGETLTVFQPRLQVEVAGWLLRGDLDILRLERHEGGALRALIADMKSSRAARVEHRLQVAFYHEMLSSLFAAGGVPCAELGMAVLYKEAADAAAGLKPEELEELERQREAALRLFGAEGTLLELVADPRSYLGAVRDLVTGPGSAARRVLERPFEEVPYHLAPKCDGCLYNELCMKWSAQYDDLSLLPHLTAQEKSALRAAGVANVSELAALKEPRPDDAKELVAAPGRERLVGRLSATWPVGPRLDELAHRARRYRKWKGDRTEALGYIPSKGYGSLPYSAPGHNPNLVRVYIDAQHDYLHDCLYMLGALISACERGEPRPERQRSVVRLTQGPPDTAAKEEELFVGWIEETVRAIVELAAPDEEGQPRAPIHLIFYDSQEQRLLLDGLGRHLNTLLGATPLYDFVTQLAAYDSPVVTFLDQEIRELKNYPMVCQSLQAVAAYLKFDWNSPEPYREIFRARLFDFWRRLDPQDGHPPGEAGWYTSRARFGSRIPLEFAYAAWGDLETELGSVKPGEREAYLGATPDLLRGFETRRLEAMEWIVAREFRGNDKTTKTPFDLPDLATFDQKARILAHALDEFVTIERHAALAEWKAARLPPPERRVLSGNTLLVRYCEADQDPEAAATNREHERRRLLEEQLKAREPGAPLSREDRERTRWSQEGLRLRLRLDTAGLDCGLDEALRLSTLKDDARVVLCPRTDTDSRLPPEERTPYTPTPKQMLYAARADIERIDAEQGWVEVVLRASYGGKGTRGFAFPSSGARPLEDGRLYTLDPDPNDWYGYWGAKVVEGLVRGEPNALYQRLAAPDEARAAQPAAAAEGQARFLRGLNAMDAAGALHPFEPGKREYIGEHGDAPTLLVQGPPGTGKSYTTAWAVLARLQGAMAAGVPCRALLSCKTHAATDVLLEQVAGAREKLRGWSRAHPELFAAHFDRRLLDAPLLRLHPKGPTPAGVIAVPRDDEREQGAPKGADRVGGERWCVAAATPGGVYRMVKDRWPGKLFGHELFELAALDEASQMNLPEAAMATLGLAPGGRLIVVGDPRQMPPIVKHDWATEPRRTFQEYRSYESLYLSLEQLGPPRIAFEESFRLHSDMADFLRREVYHQDGINYRSNKRETLPPVEHSDPFVAAVLRPEHPLVVVVHDEASSQLSNSFEQQLIAPVLAALADPGTHALGPEHGVGVVVPHRAQRAGLQAAAPGLVRRDAQTNVVTLTAVDTVERFQGGERTVVVVSATESDREYLLASSAFLLDPRRLTVALSRAKRKMALVASRSVFELFSADEETFEHAQLWKNLLRETCTVRLWEGERLGHRVEVWGNRRPAASASDTSAATP